MPALTITVTIDVPNNKDDANKLIDLLRHADNRISNLAQEQIQKFDTLNGELDSALEHPHPPKYRQRINANYQEAQAWNSARALAQGVIWPFINGIMQTAHPESFKTNDHP